MTHLIIWQQTYECDNMNACCEMIKWVMSHLWMSHVSHINEMYQRGWSGGRHPLRPVYRLFYRALFQKRPIIYHCTVCCVFATQERKIEKKWMSRVSLTKGPYRLFYRALFQKRPIIYHCTVSVSLAKGPCLRYEPCLTWMNHVTYEWVMSHMNAPRHTHTNTVTQREKAVAQGHMGWLWLVGSIKL